MIVQNFSSVICGLVFSELRAIERRSDTASIALVRIDYTQRGGGDVTAIVSAVERHFESSIPSRIVEFDEWFLRLVRAGYRTDLWYAAMIIAGGTCHDDGFFDFRKWLVSQGRSVYAAAMKDPESLVDVVERDDPHRKWLQFELPRSRFGERSSGRMRRHISRFSSTLGSNLGEVPEGDEYDDEHQYRREIPKVVAEVYATRLKEQA